jgi:hypothetical protein
MTVCEYDPWTTILTLPHGFRVLCGRLHDVLLLNQPTDVREELADSRPQRNSLLEPHTGDNERNPFNHSYPMACWPPNLHHFIQLGFIHVSSLLRFHSQSTLIFHDLFQLLALNLILVTDCLQGLDVFLCGLQPSSQRAITAASQDRVTFLLSSTHTHTSAINTALPSVFSVHNSLTSARGEKPSALMDRDLCGNRFPRNCVATGPMEMPAL